jgi:DnaJ-class molecular chaperone
MMTNIMKPIKGRHIITTEQIDAAWKYRDQVAAVEAANDSGGDWWMEFVDGVFEELGIVRCPQSRMDWHDTGKAGTCKTCKGHGWVKMSNILITTEQIDAACRVASQTDSWATLFPLGIERCEGEGCYGSGEYIAAIDPDGRQWPDKCPGCNGHGWVRSE